MKNTGIVMDEKTRDILTREAMAYGHSRALGGSRSLAVRVIARIVDRLAKDDPEQYTRLVRLSLADATDG